MTDFGLPSAAIGLNPPKLGDVEDPAKLLKVLKEMQRQFEATQNNFDHISTQFPIGAGLLQIDQRQSRSDGIGFALTTTEHDEAIGLGVRISGDYLTFANFEFNVSGAGVGRCVGEVKSDSYGVGNADCAWAPAATGRSTVTVVNSISITTADAIYWRVRKTINAGTATLENASMLLIGPI